MHISFGQIISALNPLQPPEAQVAGITVYIIAILTIVALLMQKEGSTRDTVLLTIVIMSCLIDKITATSNLRDQVNISGFTRGSPFGSFMIRVAMFALPLVVAGGTKSPKSRPVLIGVGLLGGAYLFARWFFEIRPA
jgi:hypothetical protein